MFKVGDKVHIKPEERRENYPWYCVEGEGIIVNLNPIVVQWDVGVIYSYPSLDIFENIPRLTMPEPHEWEPPELEQKIQQNAQQQVPDLYLPGTPIELNENCPKEVRKDVARILGDELYMIKLLLTDEEIKQWKKFNHTSLTVKILIGSPMADAKIKLYYNEVSPTGKPPVKVDILNLTNNRMEYVINDNKDQWKVIDQFIINTGVGVAAHVVYNDAWRKHIMDNLVD